MFRKTSIGVAAIVFLSEDAKAVRYRPYSNTAPWYKGASTGPIDDPEYPINYVVPNFGEVDREIGVSQTNEVNAESKVGTKMTASFRVPASVPQDYFVPNFGIDNDVRVTGININQSEKNLKHTWTPTSRKDIKALQYPQNYSVPNFGVDGDVKYTLAHEKEASDLTKHVWVP